MKLNFSSSSSFFFLFLFLLQHPISATSLHRIKHLRQDLLAQLASSPTDTPPTQFFEVTKPIKLPQTKPCSYHILHHDFGFTYGKPPVQANYTPPSHCSSRKFSKIVLEWNATCQGVQFDRIFGVWLGGVELLRSCTAEPTSTGIVWNVQKDITRYSSMLMNDQILAVFLGNLVDHTYTGIYHVDIFLHFYPDVKSFNVDQPKSDGDLASGYGSPADLILPISQSLPLKDGGLWFQIVNSNDTKTKEFKIPQNAYRAVIEVYISFHENDEFWYSNPPNEYIAANNLTDTPGNGPFREVLVTLDDQIAGRVWPFTVIYTGAFQPLL